MTKMQGEFTHACMDGRAIFGDPCPKCQEYAAQQVEGALVRDACSNCGGTGKVSAPWRADQYECGFCDGTGGSGALRQPERK